MNTKWLYKILFLFTLIISSSVYADYYLKTTDNNSTSEFTKSYSKFWYEHTPHSGSNYYDYITTFSSRNVNQYATWQKSISSGEYKIYAFVPYLDSNYVVQPSTGRKYKATKNAHYSITVNGGSISNKIIPQSGGGWKYIGKYSLGSNFKIKLTDEATSYEANNYYSIVFSTIKLVPTVTSNGNSPVAKRDSPTGQNVTLAIGESQLFQFEATDVDGDIDYVQISSNGKLTDKDTCYTFCSSEGVQERYSWSSDGSYTVRGYVQDDRGNSDSVVWNVTVLPAPNTSPVVTRDIPSSQNVTLEINQSQKFQAKGTDSDSNIDYVKIYSSGKTPETNNCFTNCYYHYADKTYSWSVAGNYTVNAKVRDDDGKTSYITWNVTVNNPLPQIAKLQAYSITPSNNNIQTNQSVKFKATIKNRGNATSGNIQIKWYKDGSIFSTDWTGASQYFSKIDVGSSDDDWSSNTSFSTGGNKKIKFCISQKGSNDQYYNGVNCKEITINVTTPATPNNPPTTPSAIYKNSSTENSISIRWNASSDNDGSISKYYVEYYTNGLGSFKSCGSTSNINITCSGLSKNTDYQFRIKAKDNDGDYSSWKYSSYFSTDSETQYAPVLNNTQDLPDCKNQNDKCVKVGESVILKFNITDQNSNLSRIEINWDGVGSPEDTQSISGSNANITTSHTFNSSDIANCPNNDIFRVDGVCYRKDITVTATVYDTTGKTSNSFFQEFVLYDWAGWNDAKERENNAKKDNQSKENAFYDKYVNCDFTPSDPSLYPSKCKESAIKDLVEMLSKAHAESNGLMCHSDSDTLIPDNPKWDPNQHYSNLNEPAYYPSDDTYVFEDTTDYSIKTKFGAKELKDYSGANYPALVWIDFKKDSIPNVKYEVRNYSQLKSKIIELRNYADGVSEISNKDKKNISEIIKDIASKISIYPQLELISAPIYIQSFFISDNQDDLKEAIRLSLEDLNINPDSELGLELSSIAVDLTPIVGNIKAIGQLLVGQDLITGQECNRWIEAVGVIPVLSYAVRIKKVVKIGEKLRKPAKDIYGFIYKVKIKYQFLRGNKLYAKASLGVAKTKNYRATFFKAYPELEGVKIVVHHAVPQKMFKNDFFKGVYDEMEIHSIENLRGIPDGESAMHNEITQKWKIFLDDFQFNKLRQPTKNELTDFATKIDDIYGKLTLPIIR
ncbi:MAG: hypothetical protein FE834_00025 [Gammaproteobacteria bacterium]|nr:hypothetical protein [Gammaproteobacteria bacterium]